MNNADIVADNVQLRNKSALEIVQWGVARGNGHALVTTNFRPFEAVVLHLCTQVQPDMSVLWVDHGYNRPATYRYAQKLRDRLRLNLKLYSPRMTAAHHDAVYGAIPTIEDEAELKRFSAVMKLEPFQRGMEELAPAIWFTSLRKVQNEFRAGLDILSEDKTYGTLKISPVFYWTDAEMEAYMKQHDLPNEWDYFDPAKADEKRECGIHVNS
ncbi:phosphoadenylylsulfate reductase [Nitrosomonas sp. JL21]|uniref:phosphoadenosine phosphosulfate reductase domain-containing protein n=1 Tax=Nitrosomonas sp. JL21 TaxID=153949 RepID=UPI001368CD08|nr:phosphoadenosine phosphosulfate reductase family protein [Nitrosomonas sp. JL21]MBL8496849.1 phosphoadenosine phosphosulfate reductase family protein [Nitrosomonas sp.]MBL8498399.1 phosphoadenosine phosphosulfate reductase family protein [Nitrosomonas sp.]MXS77623.1 phosphoadenylylsulfate reductase [Nitrosomonas sp. JL21]